MIAERSITAQKIIESISVKANKVGFVIEAELTEALQYLETKGIPNNKHEDYKYCNMDAVFKKEFKNIVQEYNEIKNSDVKPYKLEEAINLVVANGNYNESLSDKIIVKGITIKCLNDLSGKDSRIGSLAKSSADAFISLSNAFSGNGIYLQVQKGNVIQMPINIIYINSTKAESMINPRSFIHIEANAEVTISERFANVGKKSFSNFVSEKLVEENAKLTSYSIQEEGTESFSVNTNQVKVGRYATYDNTTVTLSGQLVRNNHNVLIAGENSQSHLNGLFLTSGTQLVDNHTLMDHQVPNCESSELYKGVINEKSIGVFNGKIYVRKDAQKTNAYQSSKNILLSDDATINTKPQLEIYADDVKCSHGTSTGKIDENALFYLKARGIGEESARKLLLAAFANEVVDKIQIESLRMHLETKLNNLY
ncbi:MAG: Fe-S cluster assembly protein SufD [Bacteroidota bacterium]|nr:Fe-S cluster assembly protein SufD [Bacteroidota bacterium]